MSTIELTSEWVNDLCQRVSVTREEIIRAFAEQMANRGSTVDGAMSHISQWLKISKDEARGLYDMLCE